MPPKPFSLDKASGAAPTATHTAAPQPSYMPPPVAAGTAMVPASPDAAALQPRNNPNLTRTGSGTASTMETIASVGMRSQQGVSDLSSKLAASVKTSDMDQLGSMLGQTLIAAKGFDPDNLKGKWLGLIKRKVEEVRIGYESAESTVNRLIGQIDLRLATHRQRDADIAAMMVANLNYQQQLGPEIQQLLENAAWMEANLPAVDVTDPASAQQLQDWQSVIVQAHKHADDLRRSQVVSQQMHVQMGILKQNGLALVQKFDSFKTTTMPILRQAFVQYIMALEQERSASMATSIDDLTDNTLKKNAEKLGQTTKAVQASLTRSSISLDAITAGNTAVIQALDDIEQARKDMLARLKAEAPQIEQASRDLAARLARPAA